MVLLELAKGKELEMHLVIQCSLKDFFQVDGPGVQTTDPWITKPALYLYTMGDPLISRKDDLLNDYQKLKGKQVPNIMND